ncbi:MAG: prolyl oligopeptidase family serine peptidase [Ktedonobacteraceae bacterium]|nr:prolyl oligopeptidase family serine peptidase [Ktedonobacteraceae bacterium]
MKTQQVAPYGSWKSPITSELITSGSIRLASIVLDGQDVYWSESRPTEKGRTVIVCRVVDDKTTDVIPPAFNARTRVHEYGGGAFTASNGVLYFSNFADDRLYRLSPGSEPTPITPVRQLRYADMLVDVRRKLLICVREDHEAEEGQATNTLVSIALDGDNEGGRVLVSGNDFYSSPCLSPDGTKLAWLSWNHPNMPWDGTELWVAEVQDDGSLRGATCVVGGNGESIFQPQWSPDSILYFVSDRSGWWNLYRLKYGQIEPLHEKAAEFGLPQWIFGQSTYAFISPQHIACLYNEQGIIHLALLDTNTGSLEVTQTPYTAMTGIKASVERVFFLAASPKEAAAIVQLDLDTQQITVLKRSSNVAVDAAYFSLPEAIEFPTEHGRTAFAFYYPPHNPDYSAPNDELPPLIVMSHGGPTATASNALDLEKQFWTSRGFAILDVNYGGSTGYGRAYRERLNGQWGIVDVDDCVNGAKYLVQRGLVDGNRLAITGGSAGGYTTLCALTFRDVFKVGASYYGVSDLESLETDTHKFESRYSDSLIGPYPEQLELYRQRSPIHFSERLAHPVIFFQGLEDAIVPPNQAERMVEALRAKGIPVAYVPFAGEGHGFRQAENIKRALEGELYFYSKVLGFELADPVEPVDIENI